MNVFDYLFDESRSLNKDFVLGPDETLTYKKVYQDSLKFASFLRRTIGENQNVVIASHNSVFFITAYLGVIKSGNICVPIDPSLELENFNFILNSTECQCVVYSDRFDKIIQDSVVNRICESRLEEILTDSKSEIVNFGKNFDHNRVAEILYTSGSTGVPKGVMISHMNVISNTCSIVKYLKLGSSDVMGVVLPFHYCYGLSLLHTHLKVGGSIVLINNFIFLSTVIKNLNKFKCTGFAGVPSHFQILLKKSKTFKQTRFPHLRYVTQAGGKLHNNFIVEFITNFPRINFFVMYGQTEATARLSYLPPDKLKEKMGSIGKSIPDVFLKVLDEDGKAVKNGQLGEIVAKGDNIMLGYHKDTEGTKSVLKNGWLYTGDLGRIDEEGYIFLESRKKEIIKVGGKRVSPKEIEEVILSVPEVIDCTIKGVCDELLGEAIKAHIVLNKDCEKKQMKKIILRKCHDNLQIHKIPQIISFEKLMRVSSTGKKIKSHSVL